MAHKFIHCINTMTPGNPALKDHAAAQAGCANIWYPSIRAMQSMKTDPVNQSLCKSFTGNPGDPADDDWFGEGFQFGTQIEDLLVKGWPEGVKKVLTLSDKIKMPPATSIRRKIVRGDSGEHLDMMEVYAGRLDKAWSTKRRKQPGVRSIAIAVQLGDNCNIQANVLYWRGACCLALAKLFMTSGYAVQIVGYTITSGGYAGVDEYFCEMFPIKQYHDDLNLNTLTTVIACAGFFRWTMFKAFCAQPEKAENSLGHSVSAVPPMLNNPDNTIFGADHILKDFHTVKNEETALKKIKQEVDRLVLASNKITRKEVANA